MPRPSQWPHARFVNVNARTRDELYTLAKELQCSEAQVIRNALALYIPNKLAEVGIPPVAIISDRSDAVPGEWKPKGNRKKPLPRLPVFEVSTRIKGE